MITIVDQGDFHLYQPGFLLLPLAGCSVLGAQREPCRHGKST